MSSQISLIAVSPTVRTVVRQTTLEVAFAGDWVLDAVVPSCESLLTHEAGDCTELVFVTDHLGRWDSMLMIELRRLIDAAESQGLRVDIATLPQGIQGLLRLTGAVPERSDARRLQTRVHWSETLSRQMRMAIEHGCDMLVFLGEMAKAVMAVLAGRARFRQSDLWLNIQECGPSALPIVSIISLLVGLILAFVGAVQLSLFGAQIYIANLVSLGMTREMGGLMTAIIISGRTGAAYAAQLGTMRVNEEIDALKTMNLEPMAFLVLPRMLALSLIMPLLCLYADLMGIIGGALVTINFFDVSLTEYIDRTMHAAKFKDFAIGFVKCSVFGVLIALSGCMRGMQCGRSASAVGDAATSAVVTSIVFIVVADSIMTLICNRLKI